MDHISRLFFCLCIFRIFISIHANTNCFNPEIIVADCSNLGLIDVPQNLSRKAEKMYLILNSITTISNDTFKRYTQLKELNLCCNMIDDIKEGSFEYMEKLHTLDLSGNAFKEFDQRLPTLSILNLGHGSLKYFNIRDSTVKRIYLSNTELDKFPEFQSPDTLKSLYIDETKIKTISVEDIAPLCNLVKLKFTANYSGKCDCEYFEKWIPHLDDSGQECPKNRCLANELKLSNKDKNFRNKCTLKENNGRTCTYYETSGHLFANCSYLNYEEVPNNLKSNITGLILSENLIKHLDDSSFENYPQLQHLDLSYNKIDLIDFDAFRDLDLVGLNLQGNKIEYFIPHNLRSQNLNISYNPLTRVNIYSSNVENLNLVATKLNHFPVLNPNILQLDLAETELSVFVDEVKHLKELRKFIYTNASVNYKNSCQCLQLAKWVKGHVKDFKILSCSKISCSEQLLQSEYERKMPRNPLELHWLPVNMLSYTIGLFLLNKRRMFLIFIGIRALFIVINFLIVL